MTRTHLPARPATSARLRRLAAVALLAALGACSRDTVEPKLVGTWQTAVASPAGPYELRFTTAANGLYRTDPQGPAPAPAESGLFKASGGKWRREKVDGGSDEGSYEFLSPDTVVFKSKTQTLLWSRVRNDVAAATTPAAAALGGAAPGVGATTAAQPTAELVAAGPFGAPLAPAAARLVPSATSEGSFGAAGPSPSPQQTPAAGANGPQSQPAAASAPGEQPPSYAQHARQAKAEAAAAAGDAAVAANDAKNAVKAQADQVSQSLGPFRKAGSKIKNFFTGHKADDASGSTSAPAQNGH